MKPVMEKRCLYCYDPLENGDSDFHAACSKRMFGASQPPVIDFNLQQLEALAGKVLLQSKVVTGVQPKLSLHLERHRNEPSRLTIVGVHGDYILKPPSSRYEELPGNEDLTMHLAEAANIVTARHTLIRLKSGELAYLTKRFDRDHGEKIAAEDLCQLSENLTEHKYRGSLEMIGKIVRRHTSNKGFEAQRLFELTLFCYLTGNADMHLKNFMLIENTMGEYELSPAYDLLSTALVMPNDKDESALTIHGKRNKLTIEDFNALAGSLLINDKSLQAIYSRFKQLLPEWIELVGHSFLTSEMQQRYLQLLTARHQRLFT